MKTLVRLLGKETEVGKISNKTIHLLVQSLKEEGASACVINRVLERLRATMNYAVENWEIEIERFPKFGNFMQDVPDEREIYLTYEEIATLIALLPEHIQLAAAWSYYTGRRLNETRSMVWEKVFLDRRFVIVKTKSRKKDGTRRVPINAKALAVLEMIGVKMSGAVFDLTNRRKEFEAARKAIGREDFRWHDWRHLTATHARMIAKPNQKLIGRTLGQKSQQATQRYMHAFDEEVIELLDQLPNVLSVCESEPKLLSNTPIQDRNR